MERSKKTPKTMRKRERLDDETGTEGTKVSRYSPGLPTRTALLSSGSMANAASVLEMTQNNFRAFPHSMRGQYFPTSTQVQMQRFFSGNQLAAGGLLPPSMNSFGGAALFPQRMLNPWGIVDQELAIRQLNAHQLQLLAQSSEYPPSVLLQMFTMQNQSIGTTPRAGAVANSASLAAASAWAASGSARSDALVNAMSPMALDPRLQRSLPPAAGTDARELSSPVAIETDEKPDAFGLTGRAPLLLYQEHDEGRLTPYQCLARKHLEYFEADQARVEEGAQGRNKAIVLGQVGIRCIHCSNLKRKEKAPAAAFYPSKLAGLYQSAQNIVNSHLAKDCTKVPKEVRAKLLSMGNRKSAPGAGKLYWSEQATRVGVFEHSSGLRFASEGGGPAAPPPSKPGLKRVPKERPLRVPVERPRVVHQLEP